MQSSQGGRAAAPSLAECDRILTAPGSPFEVVQLKIGGRVLPAWKNTPKTYRDFLLDNLPKWGDAPFISSPVPEPNEAGAREEITFKEMYRGALVHAAWMRGLGVKQGSLVAIGGLNSIPWVMLWFSCLLLGAVAVPLNSTLQTEGQVHCLALTSPVLVLVDEGTARQLAPVRAELDAKRVGPIYSWATLSHCDAEVRRVVQEIGKVVPNEAVIRDVETGVGIKDLGPESDGMVFFTSGTSGFPKAVLSSHRAGMHPLVTASFTGARTMLRAGMTFKEILTAPKPPPSVMLLAVPLFHVTGSIALTLRAVNLGSKIVFQRRWSVPDAIKLILEHKVTYIGGVPSIAVAIVQSPDLPRDYTFTAISYGGAPPPTRLAGDLRKRWPDLGLGTTWGMTETNSIHTTLGGDDYINRTTCSGPPIPIGEVKVVDPETRLEVPRGQMGLILARGSNIMKCYFNDREATAKVFDSEGWLDTGDMGLLDEDRWLHVLDRAKDMIIRGGENIPSAEVENALAQDDRLAEVAAVPVPDDMLGERVGAAVSLAPGCSADEASVIAEVTKRLRYPSRPVICIVSPVPLPRNANGKIIKSEVKVMVQEEWKRRVASGTAEIPKPGKDEPRAKL